MSQLDKPTLRARPGAPALRTGVSLALGGGFARGFAHLGVLQVLEQNQIPIAAIAGTSVGSILGAAYASGAPLARIIATCRTLRFRAIASSAPVRCGLRSRYFRRHSGWPPWRSVKHLPSREPRRQRRAEAPAGSLGTPRGSRSPPRRAIPCLGRLRPRWRSHRSWRRSGPL